MTVRILVTVSRTWSEWPTMREALATIRARHPEAVLVHGDAPKGDRDAAGIWRGLGGKVEAWPADWANCAPDCRHGEVVRQIFGVRKTHCPYAGYRRNLAMVESAPSLVLAFINKNSKGASHCAQAAEDAGIPTLRYVQGLSELFSSLGSDAL